MGQCGTDRIRQQHGVLERFARQVRSVERGPGIRTGGPGVKPLLQTVQIFRTGDGHDLVDHARQNEEIAQHEHRRRNAPEPVQPT
jgi:hypothetical protein